MTINSNQPQGVHLVGSVPLENSQTVFSKASEILGQHLRRMPDGETGERTNWISWQKEVFATTPQLEQVKPRDDDYGRAIPQAKLREGFSANDINFGPLGYSAAALASYADFAQLKAAEAIPANCRFQVCLPTPLAPLQFYIAMENRADIEPMYEKKLLAELDEILAAIPAGELAIQWDTAVEFGILEGVFPNHLENPHAGIMTRLIRLGNRVPAGVELGYHLCYGDSGHRHFVEPQDARLLVNVANEIGANLDRPLNWIHLPVPRSRDDDAYFLPLQELRLPSETELYLGLIHMTDGVEGAEQRIQAAKTAVSHFGIATECGFGRRPAATVPELMRVHTAVSTAITHEI
ncbi:MAG: hypothetical protein AAF614_37510 [Chloroflexota bacterium]